MADPDKIINRMREGGQTAHPYHALGTTSPQLDCEMDRAIHCWKWRECLRTRDMAKSAPPMPCSATVDFGITGWSEAAHIPSTPLRPIVLDRSSKSSSRAKDGPRNTYIGA